MKTIDNTKLQAVIETLDAMKRYHATYAQAAKEFIGAFTIILGEEHSDEIQMLAAAALEEIAHKK